MTVKRSLLVLICLGMFAMPAGAAGGDELAILSFPIGIVTGEVPVDVDLGPSRAPATLYLDGSAVCAVAADATRCRVDLGAEPHVHLLELVRQDSAGREMARATRWINRPGLEAEARVLLAPRSADGVCGGRLLFAHPAKQKPVSYQVEENGRGLRIDEDGRSFRFPCPDPAEPHLITASAVFPDGARAETVSLTGGFGGETEAGLRAVALQADAAATAGCGEIARAIDTSVIAAGDAGFEVVFVLDPRAGYSTLYSSGAGTRTGPQRRAFATLHSASSLWFVMPDAKLSRVNGFQLGRELWLRMLFTTGVHKLAGEPRIADAVAASGLVAAAGPRRRAVVLLLGGRDGPDASTFTPAEARAYLAEVGVPLVVLRNGRRHDDGWPDGVPVLNMGALATALEDLRDVLDRQCVVWLPNQVSQTTVAAALPPGVAIAGRSSDDPTAGAELWRRAELATGVGRDAEMAKAAGESIDVTAAAVLLRARDGDGRAVDDLDGGELSVTEDGEPATVLALERIAAIEPRPTAVAIENRSEADDRVAGAELPVLIYVDTRFGGKAATSAALDKLERRADWLTSLGPVDLVLAGSEIATPLAGSRDPGEVRDALAAAATVGAGRHQVDLIRGRFLREIRRLPQRAGSITAGGAMGHSTVLINARATIAEEDARIDATLRRLREWASAAGPGPRLLLLVGTSFDEDPLEFYLPFIKQMEPMNESRARDELRRPQRSEAVVALGRDLAAAGWTVVPMAASSVPTSSSATAAEVAGGTRFQGFLGAGLEADSTVDEGWLQVSPLTAQRHLAGPSGGTVAYGDAGLDDLVAGSQGWYRLSYQVERPPDGAPHRLEVACDRPGVELQATSVVIAGTSEDWAADRLRRLLAGGQRAGTLPLDLSLGEGSGGSDRQERRVDVSVTVDLGPVLGLLPPGGERSLRVSVGVATGDPQPFVSHSTHRVAGTITGWRLDVPLAYRAGAVRLAIVVEDLASGAWGGAAAALPP